MGKETRYSWSDMELVYMYDQLEGGASYQEVADELMIEKRRLVELITYYAKKKRYGFHRLDIYINRTIQQKWTDEEIKIVVSELKYGRTHREIAEKMGKTRGSVSCLLSYFRHKAKDKGASYGIDRYVMRPYTKPVMWTAEEIELITKLYKEGFESSGVAKMSGISHQRVYSKLRSLGIWEKGRDVF